MSIFSKFKRQPFRNRKRAGSLIRDLYARYVAVVVILLVLVAAIQFESLHSALVVANENNLSFALRDALSESAIEQGITPQTFAKAAPRLLLALSMRGINVRLYDPQLHPIGERLSKYDPANLIPVRPDMLQVMRKNETRVCRIASAYVMQTHGQMLLLATVGSSRQIAGYVELGYSESLLYPILLQQSLKFLLISLLVVVFVAAILIPVIRAPLRPLHRLIETALRIRDGAFQERFPLVGTHETVRLAEIINDALDLLASSVKREQDATERMKQFVSDASHELRTPLTAIRGFTDVLLRRLDSYVQDLEVLQRSVHLKTELPDELMARLLTNAEKVTGMRQGLLTMQRETGRLEELVRDLLQLAKLEQGLKPQLFDVELSAVVEMLQPQFQVLAGARQIIYDLRPVVILCDQSMLQQILYNLVMNAIQHTDPKQGIIQVRLRPLEKQRALLTVTDNGSGIAKEQLARIFDRFYRASGARERHPGGAGLGLAIVAEIVRVHNGRIWAESELGVGTTMFVEL
ncbi:sensor histidine kinase [Sulfoacidibacillus thermotolerans]|uniref:histidine kinase n=1 Tax=Sulfoacidibacillus thermotolerans TaxID=1765684 RepID=A0A2U3DCF8_SULT2|nr:ATP-binding protein [Sulfoacidibacillus thermotolerans]PWI58973.1 hypothetical protein BM613_02560 [Sulfoacidibacillus thermotolerans]